ncbi:MAG: phosphodiester glycosidase family protein [Candidatus Eremiobacteraeota bacterium]|nr:phosphodiester glycosidase family protein [Candidatus Eremiobacteraeota bacterium]
MQPEVGVTFAALEPVNATPGRYRVASIGPISSGEPARFGVAFGELIHEPLPHAGDVVTMHYATEPSLDGVSAVIGGGPQLLRDGAWYEDPHAPAPDERDVRWPVVAVARLPDERVLFVSADGRHPERAVGMTRPEFAKMLQAFGAIDAFALDSGGSVTMVARTPFSSDVQVRNRPSDDDGERFISNGLFVYSSAAPDATPAPRVVMRNGVTLH